MARFDPQYIAAYYDEYAERELARWQTGPASRMQHAIYLHHLHRRIRAGNAVLDAGCGPGVFARSLLELGAEVTCLDLSPVQLEACRRLAPGAKRYELGSITDLGRFRDDTFDVSLALGGSVSYCFERAPDAITELARVTRPGGAIGLSVMNLFGSLHRFMPAVLRAPARVNRNILATGDLERDTNERHECHLFQVEELRDLLVTAGLTEIELFAHGWLVANDELDIPASGTEDWDLLLDAELRASRESPGAGTHIIAWARVPS